MVAGMVLDQNGNPVPIVERLKHRFGIGSVCIVAGRAMIGAGTRAEVELREWQYILGARMRSSTEAKAVLARASRNTEVHPKRAHRDLIVNYFPA